MTEQKLKAIIKQCAYSYGISPYDELFVDIDELLKKKNITIDQFVKMVYDKFIFANDDWECDYVSTINAVKEFVKRELYKIGNIYGRQTFAKLYHDTSNEFSELMQNLHFYWLECEDEASVEVNVTFNKSNGESQTKRIGWYNKYIE